jgi:hypothetical protein
MSKLVYRVHPIPPTLKDYIFDFGALEPDTESLYIRSMVVHSHEISDILAHHQSTVVAVIAAMICRAQEFVRLYEGDPSVVSLRDVKRVLVLFRWFFKELPEQTTSQVIPLARAITLALAHVYCYRIPSSTVREDLWDNVSAEIRDHFAKYGLVKEFQPLSVDKTLQVVVAHAQKVFVDNLEIEDGISMNEALSENLFVSIVCILNKIPIFIVGKPGTSKTLAIQVIASNLRGDKSVRPFWHDKPSVHIFQYQCSPLSTSNSIKFQFESAKAFQEHSSNVLTVLLLDEVGLAENSPDMPLKVLHYMLVNPPIAIVGLSNWTLDSSKMNRAVCLQRPEPSEIDIMVTGRSIVATDDAAKAVINAYSSSATATMLSAPGTLRRQTSYSSSAKPWLGPLAKAFHEIYTQQKILLGLGRDFIGMRDYYGLLKFLRVNTFDKELTPEILARAVARNLGGRPDSFSLILSMFINACFPKKTSQESVVMPQIPSVKDLIYENLRNLYPGATNGLISNDCRHLMILSQNEAVLQLLFGCKVVDEAATSVLIGSKFKDDLDELHLIQQINKVKRAMQEGKVAVLVHNENIYESLYDLLNQRYVKQRDPVTKEEIRLLRLAMGSKSQLCPVHDNFKLIVVVQQSHAYESLDLPLLNRFEKQVLAPKDLLCSEDALYLLASLDAWCENLLAEVSLPTIGAIFCGFNEDTLSSLILNLTNFGHSSRGLRVDELLLQAKLVLLKMASPLAILHSKTLKALIQLESEVESYMASRSHLFALLSYELDHACGPSSDLIILATRAPVHHFELSLQNWLRRNSTDGTDAQFSGPVNTVSRWTESDILIIQLAHVTSERTLIHAVEKFYSDTSEGAPKMLTVLADPLYCPASVISHARQIVLQGYLTCRHQNGPSRIAMFVIHLPEGVSSRMRGFKLDMYPPWMYLFLDELIDPSDAGLPDLMRLLSIPLHDLCSTPSLVDVSKILTTSFQSAMRYCSIPQLTNADDSRAETSYVKMLKELLSTDSFLAFVKDAVLRCVHQTEDSWRMSKNGSMELHVYRACENLKGSLRQSLQLTVEGIVIQALAHVLRQLDCNYNLTLLYSRMELQPKSFGPSDSFMDIWLGMAYILLSPEAIALKCSFDLSLPAPNLTVANTGLGGAFACRFPFSEKLINQLQQTIHKAPETLGSTIAERCQSLTALIRTTFSTSNSTYADVCIPAVLKCDTYQPVMRNASSSNSSINTDDTVFATAYLYDFVASIIYPMPGITLVDEMTVMISFFRGTSSALGVDPKDIYQPGYVHALYWLLETRVYHFLSAISRIGCSAKLYGCPHLLPSDFNERVNACLRSLFYVSSLKVLDFSLLQLILGSLRCSLHIVVAAEVSNADYNSNVFKWSLLFGSLLTDIEALVTILLDNGTRGEPSDNQSNFELGILRDIWFLKLVNAIFSAYGANANMSSNGKELLSSLLNRLKDVSLDPTSHESFAIFCQLSETESSGVYHSLLTHCYLSKFAMPEFELLKRVGRSSVVSSAFLLSLGQHAAQLISQDFEMPSSGNPMTQMSPREKMCKEHRMVLIRFIVDVVYKAFEDETHCDEVCQVLNQILDISEATGLRFLQIFLERISAAYSSNMDLSNDVRLCTELSESTCGSVARLRQLFRLDNSTDNVKTGHNLMLHLVKAKVLLKIYAQQLLAQLKDSYLTRRPSIPSLPCNLELVTKSVLASQVFTLSTIYRGGGKNALVMYLQLPCPPVLPFGVTAIDPNAAKIKLLDPFSMLCNYQAYNVACTAVIQLQMKSSLEAIEAWSKVFIREYKQSSWTDKICILIAAVHTQVSSSGFSIPHETAESLLEWVRADYNSRKSVPSSSTSTVSLSLYLDLLRSCLRSPNNISFPDTSDSRRCLLENLRMHASFLASSSASGWLHSLLTDPASLCTCFLPGMLDDEATAMMLFTDGSGNVQELGWYECPNGHRYAVGECTLPMQEAKCPECKAPIGGRNHTAVGGVKRLGKTSETTAITSKTGYLLSVTIGPRAHEIVRLGKLTTVVLRLFQHLIMLTSATVYPELTLEMKDNRCGAKSTLGPLLFPESKKAPDTELIINALSERIINDWISLLSILNMNEEDAAMGLHMMINKLYFTGETRYTADESSYGKSLTGILICSFSKICIPPVYVYYLRPSVRTAGRRTRTRHS